jgi:hypothetical protein
MGRKDKVPKHIKESFNDRLTRQSKNLQSVEKSQYTRQFNDHVQRETSSNSFVDPDKQVYSDRSMRRLKQQYDYVERKSQKKSEERTEAYLNIRNHGSLAAMLTSLFRIVHIYNFYTTDDVAILVHKWSAPVVITSREAIALSEKSNISVSVTGNQEKQRVLQFSVSLQGTGIAQVIVMKFWDYAFEHLIEKPFIRGPFDDEGRFYVMLYHPDMEKTTMAAAQYNSIIVPRLLELRKDMIAREIGGLDALRVSTTTYNSTSTSSSRSTSDIADDQGQRGTQRVTEMKRINGKIINVLTIRMMSCIKILPEFYSNCFTKIKIFEKILNGLLLSLMALKSSSKRRSPT